MKKDPVDLANKVVFIADSKTPTGISEVPLTGIAVEAFRNQPGNGQPRDRLFPSSQKPNEHQADFKKPGAEHSRELGCHISGCTI